jgi:uncharacterized sodium:solute symporter family permease YidK
VLGLGFVLSFGYWTTNFAEVQRALSTKSMSAARRTPLIGAYPKIFIPALTIIPGLVALVTVKGLGGAAKTANRFDIRRIIGGLFLLYGAILVVVGFAGSEAVKNKAAGINVNLWTGLGMLVFGALMVFWALSRPTVRDVPED